MSRVLLLAADKPLPLCDRQTERTRTVSLSGKTFTITAMGGFAVREHSYYRSSVDELGYPMKPYQYELEIEIGEEDLADFRAYLEEQFASGEEIELWNLWVGDDDLGHVPHYRGPMADFDLDTLAQFERPPHPDGGIGQCCMTIVI